METNSHVVSKFRWSIEHAKFYVILVFHATANMTLEKSIQSQFRFQTGNLSQEKTYQQNKMKGKNTTSVNIDSRNVLKIE